MKGEEPSASLVNAFGNEICRESAAALYKFCVFKRIVQLCIRHGTGIEPYINKVGFSTHRFAARRYQDIIIHVGAMQIYFLIVFFAVVARYKSFVAKGVGTHDSRSNRLVYFFIESFD